MKIAVFQINQQSYGIPIDDILEINHAPSDLNGFPTQLQMEGIIDIRDKVYYVFDLRKAFQVNSPIPEKRKMIVLSKHQIALIVDEVSQIIDVEHENLQSTNTLTSFHPVQMFPNVLQLENGLITLLDVDFLIKNADAIFASAS